MTIDYAIERRPRRKRIGIIVERDGRVRVLAPPMVDEGRLHAWVASKRDWIERQRRRMREIRGPGELLPGGHVEVLGKRRRIVCNPDGRCALLADTLHLDLAPEAPASMVCVRIEAVLIGAALSHFSSRAAHFAPRMQVRPRQIGIKGYRTRWGSCHRDGRIYFNWRLMLAPQFVVDYVVVHELAHLRHADHSRRFWAFVKRILPEYADAHAWLRIHGIGLELV